LVPAGNGFYRLTTTLNGEVMCLDIWNSERLEAHLGACANYSGQFWRISHVGGARLSTQFRGEDFCLDVWSDTLQAHLAPCANYSGQLWLLAKVSEGAAPGKMRITKPLVPEEEKALKPKDAFKECDVCPEMIVVAAGSFTMGSPKNEPHRIDIEGPQHRVNFAKPFAVGKFEVTVDEFKAFANETGHDTISDCREDGLNGRRNLSWRDPGFPQSGAHPVTCLSWDDAKAYVLWLAKKTSAPYRLLTESEWEYVVRAGTTTTGSTISAKQANIGLSNRGTVPVDSFQPNPWGLYQVHGNVFEWVEDCYASSYTMVPTDGSAFTAGKGFADNACNFRIMRGAAWNYSAELVRSAYRYFWGGLTDRNNTYGLRLARTLQR
jgi:formylglycine-generating enzyme required for sulfatase activity